MKTYKKLICSRARLVTFLSNTVGCVTYDFGSKPRLTMSSTDFKVSDCSGFVRKMVFYITGGLISIPQGSSLQNNFCKNQGFQSCLYSDCNQLDGKLRIAFMNRECSEPGHVWLVLNGQTIECAGGKGACRRPWDNKILAKKVDACYILTDELK